MAELYFTTEKIDTDTQEIIVRLDSRESVNAISGSLHVANGLKVEDINIGQSIINFWIESPKFNESNNEINFSGIIPGGFLGADGEIFELSLTGKTNINSFTWNKKETKVLLNNGAGDEAKLIITGVKDSPWASLRTVLDTPTLGDDKTPPESFTPLISNSPDFLNGKNFVVFSTVDKQTGIDHYELAEKRSWFEVGNSRLNWQKAVSPAILTDQKLSSFVYVKAVDESGNYQIEVIHPINPSFPFQPYLFWGIIIMLVVGLAVLVFKLFLKRRHDKISP